MTEKTNYKYYLANGVCIEYTLSPDSSLIDVIDRLALDYFNARGTLYPNEIWMQPKLVSLLNRECAKRFTTVIGNLPSPMGQQVMRIETFVGSVVIVARSALKIPIFFGSEQELEDNNFNTLMEDILA